MPQRKFTIVLIKPSHYDDDGYVIQWRRSTIPSNSLASVYGLLAECATERILGPDVDIEIEIYDECNTIVDIPGSFASASSADQRHGRAGRGSVESVSARARHRAGVSQSGRDGRGRGLPCLGLHRHAAGIAAGPEGAQALGIILYAAKAASLTSSRTLAHRSQAKPVYDYLDDMPDMAAAAITVLPRTIVVEVAGHYTRFDAGRATVPVQLRNHQRPGARVPLSDRPRRRGGRARRRRPGGRPLFRRRRQFRPQPQLGADPRPPDRIAREQGFEVRLLLQVDTLRHGYRASSTRRRQPLRRRLHRAGEHQIRSR